jgi:hypothetical protein
MAPEVECRGVEILPAVVTWAIVSQQKAHCREIGYYLQDNCRSAIHNECELLLQWNKPA